MFRSCSSQVSSETPSQVSGPIDGCTFIGNTAILGGLLAVVVLFVFLRRLKPTAIIAVSIPISLLVTFAPLNSMGITLNIMSLGGLALGIGMLVDSSIVVLESIYRCKEEGDSMTRAVIRGTLEVRSAVIASTLTSVARVLKPDAPISTRYLPGSSCSKAYVPRPAGAVEWRSEPGGRSGRDGPWPVPDDAPRSARTRRAAPCTALLPGQFRRLWLLRLAITWA